MAGKGGWGLSAVFASFATVDRNARNYTDRTDIWRCITSIMLYALMNCTVSPTIVALKFDAEAPMRDTF